MDEINNNPNKFKRNNYFLIIFIISTTFIVSILLYFFNQNRLLNQSIYKNNSEIESLKNQVNSYKNESEKLRNQIEAFENKETIQEESNTIVSSKIFGGTYKSDDYNFSFSYPDNWYFQKEESNIGSDLHCIFLTVPGFIEEATPNADHILSISVSKFSFDTNYKLLNYNVSKENEKNIIISGRESIMRTGRHEFGGYLVVVIIPNGNNAIEMSLRTNDEPYISQFQTILDSFKFN